MLSPSPRTSSLSRLRPARREGASGVLGSYTGSRTHEKPRPTRVCDDFVGKTRWGKQLRGRFYTPAWHRFINSDQGADRSTFNQMAYVGGSPFQATDPSGMYIALHKPSGNCYDITGANGNGDYTDINGVIYYTPGSGTYNIVPVSCGSTQAASDFSMPFGGPDSRDSVGGSANGQKTPCGQDRQLSSNYSGSVGVSGEIGLGFLGGIAGSASVGPDLYLPNGLADTFVHGTSGMGAHGTVGGTAYGPLSYLNPGSGRQSGFVFGAAVSTGRSVSFGNAASSNNSRGVAEQVNVTLGFVQFSYSESSDGTWSLGAGLGLGLSISGYKTKTISASVGCK